MSNDPFYGVDPEGWRDLTMEQRIQAAEHARAVDLEQRISTLERKVATLQERNERGGIPPGCRLPNPNPPPEK